MKIGILYICTGKYSVFWQNFYRNAEQFLFTEPEFEKNYFVFTDDVNIKNSKNVHVFKRNSGGFPNDSLFRFRTFLEVESALLKMEYLFFLNSNMSFVNKVGKEIIPFKENLMGVLHPGYYNETVENFPYERNRKSTAFVPNISNVEYHYFMGGFNGGKTSDFLKLCRICLENIYIDQKNGIMACFHDESHINRYFLGKNILIMPSSYGFAENTIHNFEPKVIILDKVKHHGEIFKKDYANPLALDSPFTNNTTNLKLKDIIKRIKKKLNF